MHLKTVFSKGLRWFGIIVGLGLVLVGLFPLGFAVFVDPSSLQIPAAPPKEFPQTVANKILHLVVFIGSIMGFYYFRFGQFCWDVDFFGKIQFSCTADFA